MKIIIVGGGIGGLSVYLALRKHLADSVSLKIIESHSSSQSTTLTIGGGLGLAPNGTRAIAAFSLPAAESILRDSYHGPKITLRNSQGTTLGALSKKGVERYGYDSLFVARSTVHNALLAEVLASDQVIEWGRKVVEIREVDGKVDVVFSDGTHESADLVIGADGVRSVVRPALVGEGFEATYDGLTGIGGFLDVSALPIELTKAIADDSTTATFGPDGFFGYSPCEPPTHPSPRMMWWSTFEVPEAPNRDVPMSLLRRQLLDRHASWKSPRDPLVSSTASKGVFSTIIELACGTEEQAAGVSAAGRDVLVLPRYMTSRVTKWASASGRIVIMGDAAHAMPPDAGQGVSSAVEDALTFALLLKHFTCECSNQGDALVKTATGYEALRMDHVHGIIDAAKKKGNSKRRQTWWQELLRDWILWFLCKLSFSPDDKIFSYSVPREVEGYIQRASSAS